MYFNLRNVEVADCKSSFAEYGILTVHGVIVKNALTLMHKIQNFTNSLPRSIVDLFPDNIPAFGSNYESSSDWLQTYGNCRFRGSVFYKGPILAITEHNTRIISSTLSCLFSINAYKNAATRILIELQSQGVDNEEWPNFVLNNLPGLRRSERNINTNAD